MADGQLMGFGTLMAIGSVVVGYVVYAITPQKHFPIVAGILAANAVLAGLALGGIEPASHILLWFLVATGFAAWVLASILG